jgi:hypothetical protein
VGEKFAYEFPFSRFDNHQSPQFSNFLPPRAPFIADISSGVFIVQFLNRFLSLLEAGLGDVYYPFDVFYESNFRSFVQCLFIYSIRESETEVHCASNENFGFGYATRSCFSSSPASRGLEFERLDLTCNRYRYELHCFGAVNPIKFSISFSIFDALES